MGRNSRRATILKVAEVLGMHLDHLLQSGPARDLPYAVHNLQDDAWFDLAKFDDGKLPQAAQSEPFERRKLSESNGTVPLNILASRLENGRIKPTTLELYGPSSSRSHSGEEHVFVLEGTAKVTVGDKTIVLRQNESVTFWSAEPHAYAPAEGSSLPVRLLSVRVDT